MDVDVLKEPQFIYKVGVDYYSLGREGAVRNNIPSLSEKYKRYEIALKSQNKTRLQDAISEVRRISRALVKIAREDAEIFDIDNIHESEIITFNNEMSSEELSMLLENDGLEISEQIKTLKNTLQKHDIRL